MHIEYIRDPAHLLPQVGKPTEVTSLKIWHCKYKNLDGIADFVNLRELVIATVPGQSLDFLMPLSKLSYLRLLHMPKVCNLDPLQHLQQLESLSLATSPSWDAAGKFLIVDSLEPVATLQKLRYVELFGVGQRDKSCKALLKCPNLVSARFSQYPEESVREFYSEKQISDQFVPSPTFEVD
jgi:hypothetical protein